LDSQLGSINHKEPNIFNSFYAYSFSVLLLSYVEYAEAHGTEQLQMRGGRQQNIKHKHRVKATEEEEEKQEPMGVDKSGDTEPGMVHKPWRIRWLPLEALGEEAS